MGRRTPLYRTLAASTAAARRAIVPGMRIIPIAVTIALLAAMPALAHSFSLGAIEIGHPWAPPSNAGDAPVYLALSNRGSTADRLVAAFSPRAQSVELRGGDDLLLPEITLEPKRPVALRAGRPHLMLLGVTGPLVAGDAFPLTLRFAGAGSIEVTVMIEAAPAH
jgi:copper(I)-binding protein